MRRKLQLKHPLSATLRTPWHAWPLRTHSVLLRVQQRLAPKIVPQHLLRVLRQAVCEALERRVHQVVGGGFLVGGADTAAAADTTPDTDAAAAPAASDD